MKNVKNLETLRNWTVLAMILTVGMAPLLRAGELAGTESTPGENRAINKQAELVLLRIAQSKQSVGEYTSACDMLKGALVDQPDSPALLNALGSVEQDLGEYPEAEKFYLRALGFCARSEGDPQRIVVLENLGTLYLDTGAYAKGQRIREQLQNLNLEAVAVDQPKAMGLLLNVIASLNHERNRDDEAERYYAQSLQLLRRAREPVDAEIALVESNLGFLHLEARDYDGAADLIRRSIDDLVTASGPEDPALIRPLISLARCEYLRGALIEAERHARRAVALSTKILGEEHVCTASAMLVQSATLRRLGHGALARKLERRANASLRSAPDDDRARYSVDIAELMRTENRKHQLNRQIGEHSKPGDQAAF